MLLRDRVAVVSGVGPGLGRELALALARQGADVALAARSPERLAGLAEVAEAVEALGRRAIGVPTDVTDPAACEALVERTREALGGLDVLVNSAYHPGSYARFDQDDLERWRAPLETNLFGSLRLTRAALPALRERGGGAIVMVGSMIVRRELPTMGAYAASKAALLSATRTLALELGPEAIRVNSLLPGYIWGPVLEGFFAARARERGVDPRVVYDEVAAGIPVRRIPTSEEVADAAVFLACDLSRCVTGQCLDANGGHVLA